MMALLIGLLSVATAQDAPDNPDIQPDPTTSGPESPEPFTLDFKPQPAPPSGEAPAAPAAPPTYSYDTVFLAPLQPYSPELSESAARLTASLTATLSQQHELVTVDAVPGWPDYTAGVYMSACPQGQYAGCALVCGNRVQAEWTIGGTVTPGLRGGANVELVFIENSASREVLSFGVAVEGSNDAPLIESVNTIFSKILGGAFEQVDLRAVDTNADERNRLAAVQREILAASLADLEKQQGTVSRSDVDRGQLEQPKLSREDVAAMRVKEELKPWQVLDMGESEYRRYNNSGKDINEWRRLRRGRLGQLVGRVAIGGGQGPRGQVMDGRYALDDQLQVARIEQFQYVAQAPFVQVDLEAGFGVLPFLDITGHFGYNNGPFEYFINQERIGEPVVINQDDFKRRGLGTWEVGARANLVPFMSSSVRPTLTAGLSYWQGTTWNAFIQGVANLQEMDKLSVMLVQVGPGVELTAGPTVNVFLRGLADVPIGGSRSEGIQLGVATLAEPVRPDEFKLSAVGITVQAGITIRIPVIGGVDKSRGSTMQFEDEDI